MRRSNLKRSCTTCACYVYTTATTHETRLVGISMIARNLKQYTENRLLWCAVRQTTTVTHTQSTTVPPAQNGGVPVAQPVGVAPVEGSPEVAVVGQQGTPSNAVS